MVDVRDECMDTCRQSEVRNIRPNIGAGTVSCGTKMQREKEKVWSYAMVA